MNKQGMKRTLGCNTTGEGCYGAFIWSDLPCMHLDPGVNRLGLYITSVHQTDRRPVAPDIVFPICVILQPQEDGVKKRKNTANKKVVNTFHKYTRQTAPHASRIRGARVSSLPSGGLGKSDFKTANQHMKMKEGESGFTAEQHSKRGEGLWEEQTADLTLWSSYKACALKTHTPVITVHGFEAPRCPFET